MKRYLKLTWEVLKFILVYLGVSFLLVIPLMVFYAIFNSSKNLDSFISSNGINITLIVSILCLICFYLMFKKRKENLWNYCRFNKLNLKDIYFIIMLALGLSWISLFINFVIDIFPEYKTVSNTYSNAAMSVIGLFYLIILAPVFEEIFFRGIIFNTLKKDINIVAALIIQALIFGIFHGNMLQFIYTSLLGVALALVYMWTNSLWSSMLFHCFYNFCGVILNNWILQKTGVIIPFIVAGLIIFSIFLCLIYKNNKFKKGEITCENCANINNL